MPCTLQLIKLFQQQSCETAYLSRLAADGQLLILCAISGVREEGGISGARADDVLSAL